MLTVFSVLFTYSLLLQIRLVFFANKFTQGSKIFIFCKQGFKSYPNNLKYPSKFKGQEKYIALLFFFFDNARIINVKENKNQSQSLIDTLSFFPFK